MRAHDRFGSGRKLTVRTAIWTAGLFLALITPAQAARRAVAVTFDDLPDITADEDTIAQQEAITGTLLAKLARGKVPAAGFVNEDKLLDEKERPNPRSMAMVEQWLRSGCVIGNHTFSHADLNKVGPEAFERDVIRGETLTLPLIQAHGQKQLWFRHPYLDTGATPEAQAAVARFLTARGYQVAPVTIDDSEWIYDLAYHRASAALRPAIARSYIRYMEARFAWCEERSRRVFGREIPQILLLHASRLNADAFDRLRQMMRGRGYEFVPLDEAMGDAAYSASELWIGDGGGWLQRWGLARGLPSAEFENDPHVPRWIQWVASAREE